MSLWVEPPELIDTATGKCIMEFADLNWSLESAAWLSEAEVTMKLRKYPGNHVPAFFEVTVNCQSEIAIVGAAASSLALVEQALERTHALGAGA